MASIGSNEAKARLAEILRRVEAGESVEITRHGKAIARLVPADGSRHEAMRRAIGDIRRLRKGIALGPGLSPRDLVEAGRRH